MIHNLHILIDPDSPPVSIQVRKRKGAVSQHIVVNKQATRKWVFGWDQTLQSFYLQVHDLKLTKDENPIVWLGATPETEMYEVEHLVQAASEHGLAIDSSYWSVLYGEKDDGL